MRAKVVVFGNPSPVYVYHAGPVLLGANAIHPVVLIGKTPTGSAQVWNVQISECADNIAANAACVGNFRIFTDVNATVNATTKMFGKVSVNVFADHSAFNTRIENKFDHEVFLLYVLSFVFEYAFSYC